MRISEAMRKGAAMRPQCHFTMFNGVGSCAIGAAIEGAGIELILSELRCTAYHEILSELCTAYPEWNPILNALVPVPTLEPADLPAPTAAIVMYLNDERLWTREDIANWLKGVEDKLIAEGKYIPVPIESAPHEID